MHVQLATSADLPSIRAAYADGRRTQRELGAIVWPEFTDAAIVDEIAAGRLLRVDDGDVLVGVFSVAYEDAAIWGELERGAHIYLHRIARASSYRGRGLVDTVLAWARLRCEALGRAGLRMDTWASNAPLIAYYERLGFRLVGRRHIASDSRLPAHYHGLDFALLEQPLPSMINEMPDSKTDPAVAASEPLIAQSLQVSLTVRDLPTSIAWYRDALGFLVDREHRREERLMAASMHAGDVRILLVQDDGAKGLDRAKGEGFSFQLTTIQSIDAIAARVRAHGGTIDTEPADIMGTRAFRLRDPDAFRITISAPRRPPDASRS